MFTWKPHPIVRDPASGQFVVDHAHAKNYLMLSHSGDTVYVQAGKVYHGNLEVPCTDSELPPWFWDSYRKLTSEARKAVGLRLPEDEIQRIDQLPAEFLETLQSLPPHLRMQLVQTPTVPEQAPRMPEKAPKISPQYEDMDAPPAGLVDDPGGSRPKLWTCDQCGEGDIPSTHKGVHVAKHARDRKRAEKLREVSA